MPTFIFETAEQELLAFEAVRAYRATGEDSTVSSGGDYYKASALADLPAYASVKGA
jgi:hypothetical protein